MGYVTTKDGTNIFYKDWGPADAQPFVFSHGWPLSADAWDGQMLFLLQHGYRVIAHDRRGHGRSDQPGYGNDIDTLADDLASLLNFLDIKNAVLVGHSMGGAEVVHYIARHGSSRITKVVLVGSVTPIMVSTDQWPDGAPLSLFDEMRKNLFDNRAQFYYDFTKMFYGFTIGGLHEGLRLNFVTQALRGGILAQYSAIHEFSEVDYTECLKKVDVPTLLIHGDDDKTVPIAHSSELAVKLLPQGRLKIYPGAPHALPATHQDELNQDLLWFAKV